MRLLRASSKMAEYRENVVSTILPLSVQSSQSSELLPDILPAFSEHRIFGLKKPDVLQSAVSEINSFLNSSKKRLQGLLLLEHVLAQCSSQVFSRSCQTWMQLLLQTLQSHASVQQHQSTLQILSTMIERVTAFPELARDVGMNKMKAIVPALLALNSKATKEAVASCIAVCILHFPGPTSFFKGKIETLLIEELDKVCPSQVYIRCYTLLARCSTGGHGGEKYRESWTAQYDKLMSTINSLLTQLYTGFETGEEAGEDTLFICPVPNTQPEQTVCLVRRFNTLCACLAALMREPFPTWIQLPMDEILRLVCRALAVQMDMLVNKASVDHLLLLTYLPMMHCAALNVLSHLIVCVKRLLVPSGEMVVKLCVHTLSSAHLHKAAAATPTAFRKLRESAYQTLGTWLQIAGPSCGVIRQVVRSRHGNTEDGGLTDLLTEVFSDIKQQQPEALQIEKYNTNESTQPPAKKKKKKGKNSNYQELAVSHAVKQQHNPDTTIAALKVLQHLIDSIGLQLPDSTFYALKRKVVCLVNDTQRLTLPPYTSAECRRVLYRVLLAAVCVARPDPSPLDQAVSLFQRGSQDAQLDVAVTCQEALARCQNLIHPTVPCLRAPVTKPLYAPTPSAINTLSLTLSDNTITTTTTTNANGTSTDAVTKSPSIDLRLQKSSSPTSSVLDGPHDTATTSTEEGAAGSVSTLHQQQELSSTSGSSAEASTKRKRGQSASSDDEDEEEEEEEGEEDGNPSNQGAAQAMEMNEGGEEVEENRKKGNGEDEGEADQQEESAEVSAMMMSFVPCEADTDEETSD